MTRQTIAVDCDDVIANINDSVREYMNETKGFSHTAEEYRVPGDYRRYWERIWKIPDDETSNWFAEYVESGRMYELDPVPGALETLARLKQNYRLVLVTARSAREVEYTEQWLSKHAPDIFDEVTYVHRWQADDGTSATKAKICQELGAEYLIDDNYDHCRLMAECGRQAVLFGDYGWNAGKPLAEGMRRAADWAAVEEFFAHEG